MKEKTFMWNTEAHDRAPNNAANMLATPPEVRIAKTLDEILKCLLRIERKLGNR